MDSPDPLLKATSESPSIKSQIITRLLLVYFLSNCLNHLLHFLIFLSLKRICLSSLYLDSQCWWEYFDNLHSPRQSASDSKVYLQLESSIWNSWYIVALQVSIWRYIHWPWPSFWNHWNSVPSRSFQFDIVDHSYFLPVTSQCVWTGCGIVKEYKMKIGLFGPSHRCESHLHALSLYPSVDFQSKYLSKWVLNVIVSAPIPSSGGLFQVFSQELWALKPILKKIPLWSLNLSPLTLNSWPRLPCSGKCIQLPTAPHYCINLHKVTSQSLVF